MARLVGGTHRAAARPVHHSITVVAKQTGARATYQRAAAERAVRSLIGVRGVTNLIKVHPRKASPVEVGRSIREALRRNAELDADRIEVEASDGTVILSGTVRSWTERQDVERAAWSAPGVTDVIDQLAISV